MWKLIFVLLLGYFLFRLFINDMKKRNSKKEEPKKDETMVKDPTCGVYVSQEIAFSVKDSDTIHYFCSDECRQAFLKQVGYKKNKETLDS